MGTYYDWSESKDQQLMNQRGISFYDVVLALDRGDLVDTVRHRDQERYPGQMVYVVEIDDYLHLVPFVTEPDGTIFFKTIIPSRKAMSLYKRR